MKGMKNILFIQSFHSFTNNILFILVPLMMAERNIDITTIGLVFAVAPMIFQLSRMGFAAISDMIGRRIFYISHGLLTTIVSAIYYFAKTPFGFLYGNIFQSVRSASIWSVNRAYVLDASKEPRKDLVALRTTDYIVAGIGNLVTGFLIVWLLYSGTLTLIFAIGLFGILIAFGLKADKNRKVIARKAFDHLDFRKRGKLFKKFLILFVISGLSYGFIDGYVFPLFLKNSGFSIEAIGVLIGMQTILSGIFLYVYTKKGNVRKVLLYSGILYSITLSILGFVNAFWIAIVFLLFGIPAGIADGCVEGIFTKITDRKSYASDIGLLFFGMYVARSINQGVAGFLIQNFGFGTVFAISATVFLIYIIWTSKILR